MSVITVIRGQGDQEGEPIVDELLTSDAAKIERGRVEIDRGTQADTITLAVRLNPAYRRGHVVEVLDDMFGPPWRGIVTGIQHMARAAQSQNDEPFAQTTLKIWRPRLG